MELDLNTAVYLCSSLAVIWRQQSILPEVNLLPKALKQILMGKDDEFFDALGRE